LEPAGRVMVQPIWIRFALVKREPSDSVWPLLSLKIWWYLSPEPSALSAMPKRVSPDTTV
jgi:hypothetical protein